MKNWLKKDKPEGKETRNSTWPDKSLQVFDYHDFLDRVMGDKELAVGILEEFTDLIGQHADKLRKAVESGDHENIRQIGHMIKGESGNISAPALYESSHAIEKAGKSQSRDEQTQLLPVLIADIDNLTQAIREVLKKENR
ncbi:MAG: Hpt domain-containing protein [Chlorobiales bacterium]|nr:Hpt domain-containing protein [Chlorobiales bacterium]